MHGLLAQSAFMRLWFARLSGTTANQMLQMAVGWQMYELTGSAWDLGLVGLFQFVPALLMSLPAGHAADRYNRLRIVMLAMAANAAVALVLLAGSQGQWINREWLFGVSVVLGAARAFQMSAQQAITPSLVPTSLLAQATAMSSAGIQAAIIGGPALAGLLFVFGERAVYGSAFVLLVLATLLCLLVRYRHVAPPPAEVTMDTLLAGVRFIWRQPVLLGAMSLDLFAVLLGGATALLPIFAKDILEVGPAGLGLLRSAPAVGALAVSIVLTRWPIHRGVGHKLLGAVAVFGLCMAVFGLSTSFWLSLAVLAISGGADMVSVVLRQTLVQLETPDAMRGRVAAVNSIFIGASNQLGEFESGVTAQWFGPVGSAVLGGIGTVLVAVAWLRLFPALARRDRMQ